MPKNVFITGANGGFGRLTTLSLLAAGHTVVATTRNIETRNAAAAEELRAAGAHVVELDVTDEASVDAAMANAVDFVGRIDVVVNNAGVGSIGLLETFTPADWQAIFDINVFGVQRVNRSALPLMRAQGSGLLVVVTSGWPCRSSVRTTQPSSPSKASPRPTAASCRRLASRPASSNRARTPRISSTG